MKQICLPPTPPHKLSERKAANLFYLKASVVRSLGPQAWGLSNKDRIGLLCMGQPTNMAAGFLRASEPGGTKDRGHCLIKNLIVVKYS